MSGTEPRTIEHGRGVAASVKLPRTFILEYLMQSLVVTVVQSLVFIYNLSWF